MSASLLLRRPSLAGRLTCVQRRWNLRKSPKPGKPPILPPAKTKRYRVVHVPWQHPDDVRELLWQRHAYNNAVNSIREYYRQVLAGAVSDSSATDSYRHEIEEEFQQLLLENDRLNAEQAKKREEETTRRRENVVQQTIAKVEDYKKKQAERRTILAQEVNDWINRSEQFVTHDNLEQKIEEALESPVDFNFALDSNGRIYKGRPLVKYSTENLLLAKPVSEESEPLVPAGQLDERVEQESPSGRQISAK